MADVALTRLKAEGHFYDFGEEVPDLDDADDLRERGVIGSAADAKKIQDEQDAAEEAAAEAQAEAEQKQAEADQLLLDAKNLLNPQISVTDMEAAELNKVEEEEPAPAKATTTSAKTADK